VTASVFAGLPSDSLPDVPTQAIDGMGMASTNIHWKPARQGTSAWPECANEHSESMGRWSAGAIQVKGQRLSWSSLERGSSNPRSGRVFPFSKSWWIETGTGPEIA